MENEKLNGLVQLRKKLERPQKKSSFDFFGGREVFEELAREAGSEGAEHDANLQKHKHCFSSQALKRKAVSFHSNQQNTLFKNI
ncbi:hypothetical protein [Listeria booriae]|uniref:hypothetical protein n=1 Tax=Listeria booriae TaxID=1552123 RepID=UPI0016297383|nr:hypothetical protein [Listeria booriae]MBC1513825.1 hypothetical protein [Listeria booriae]